MKNKSDNLNIEQDEIKKNNSEENDDLINSNSDEEKFYYALNHEIRRKIIRIIGDNGESSFTYFKKVLKISTGTLYHHLDVLSNLITQNSSKKYVLTTLGKHAYNFLSKNYESLESDKIFKEKYINKIFKTLINFTVPKGLLNLFENNFRIGISIMILILTFGFSMVFLSNLNSYFIFFTPNETLNENILIHFGLGIKFVIGIITAAIVSELLCRFFFNKTENTKKFIIAYPINVYPILIYLIIYNTLKYLIPNFNEHFINKFILVFFQAWTIWLLSYSFIKFKFIKLEHALIISLLIHYGAFSIMFFSIL